MSTNFEVILFEQGRSFEPSCMTNAFGTLGESSGVVLCSTELSLRCGQRRTQGRHLWNTSTTAADKRRSDPYTGQVECNLPGLGLDSDSSDSLSSESESSDLSDQGIIDFPDIVTCVRG